MELQVTGEPVTGELAASRKKKSHLFPCPFSQLSGITQNKVLTLIFVQSQDNLLLLLLSRRPVLVFGVLSGFSDSLEG